MRLELRDEPGGPRHYLDDRAVHAGDVVELRLGEACVVGRYEWNWRLEETPYVYTSEDEGWPLDDALGQGAELRWPQ